MPSLAGVERGSQLYLTDGVRASIWTMITKAQNIQSSAGFSYRGQTRYVAGPLVRVEGVEQAAVQPRLKAAPQTFQLEGVRGGELNLNATVGGLLSSDGQGGFSHVNAQNRESQRGDVQSVLAGAAAGIEHRSGESAS